MVLGAGPIGQCVAVVARQLGSEVLLIDLQESRLEIGRAMGVQTLLWTSAAEVVTAAREWGGPGGPPVAVDATGVPAAVRAMVDMVASAGRAVQVGMANDDAPIRIGSLTEKELDLPRGAPLRRAGLRRRRGGGRAQRPGAGPAGQPRVPARAGAPDAHPGRHDQSRPT